MAFLMMTFNFFFSLSTTNMSLWFATCLATEMTSTNWDLSDEFRRSYETQKTASATLAPPSGGGGKDVRMHETRRDVSWRENLRQRLRRR